LILTLEAQISFLSFTPVLFFSSRPKSSKKFFQKSKKQTKFRRKGGPYVLLVLKVLKGEIKEVKSLFYVQKLSFV